MSADSASETDLLTDCSDGSGPDAEDTAFETAAAEVVGGLRLPKVLKNMI